MKIGVLGTGDVGRTLASGFLDLGHSVMLGARSRDNQALAAWVRAAGPEARTGTFSEAAAFGELVVVAILGMATQQALGLIKPEHFIGKVVIDTTNPLDFSQEAPMLVIGHSDSLGEMVQRCLPQSKVVKAFNSVGAGVMVKPQLPEQPDMFIAGNDDLAKATVAELCGGLGWRAVDLGDISAARYLEPLCMVWLRHGMRSNSYTHAFKLLRG